MLTDKIEEKILNAFTLIAHELQQINVVENEKLRSDFVNLLQRMSNAMYDVEKIEEYLKSLEKEEAQNDSK